MTPTQFNQRLPINACEALFEKLKLDLTELEMAWTSPYKSFNFVITVYHLYQDWITQAGTKLQKERKDKLSKKGKLLFTAYAGECAFLTCVLRV